MARVINMDLNPKHDNLMLMLQNVEARFVHDDDGRIISLNRWYGGDAPLFFLGRTNMGNIWRFRHDVPLELVVKLTRYCTEEPFTTDSENGPMHREKYEQLFAKHSGTVSVREGISYICGNDLNLPNSTTVNIDEITVVKINETTSHLLEGCMNDWLPDVAHTHPFIAIVKDGQAVCVCGSARISDNAHHAGVETVPEYRRRGYAAQAVSAWASAVRDLGANPLYAHSLDNIASQNVARRLGMEIIGTDYFIN